MGGSDTTDTTAAQKKTDVLKKIQSRKFLTCAGTETYLYFQQGLELPEFCAFVIHEQPHEMDKLESDHLSKIFASAAESGHGLLLDTLVWRCAPDYLQKLGRDPGQEELRRVHETAIGRARSYVDKWRSNHGYDDDSFPVLIVADIGPRGDGYKLGDADLTPESFREYHSNQIQVIKELGGIDVVCAYTITSVEESIGIAQACGEADLPIIISPTVETDGKLPDGNELQTFVEKTDEATGRLPLFYMVNCSHPTHLCPTLEKAAQANESWLGRFRGFRANASSKSHEELDNSTELDRGHAVELAKKLTEMKERYGLYIIGGCCGTDHEHITAMTRAASGVN